MDDERSEVSRLSDDELRHAKNLAILAVERLALPEDHPCRIEIRQGIDGRSPAVSVLVELIGDDERIIEVLPSTDPIALASKIEAAADELVAREQLSRPEHLVWAAIRRMNADRAYPGLVFWPSLWCGLFVDVEVTGGPMRTFELDESRLQSIIDSSDSDAVEAAIEGITAGIEAAIREVRDAQERVRLDRSVDYRQLMWRRPIADLPAATLPYAPSKVCG